MLEAFDLTGSLRGAGELAGVSHHTVARYVAERDAGELAGDGPRRRGRIIDPFLPKIEEWVERSHAKIRADRAFDKLTALGYTGSERTVRRAVAEVKANHRRGRRRVYRPWIPEPGMWAQWDWGAGPVIAGRRTNLFCAWLAWSRFRVVVPCWDRTLPTVIACVNRAMRAFGGAPTYSLTDNEARSRSTTSPGSLCAIGRSSRSAATTGSRCANVCAGGPRVQRRQRGDGAGHQSRLGANRRQFARRLHQLGRAGRGLRRVDGRD